MAFPYEFVENFELGTKGNFDSESDDGNRLDFPHQRDLPPGMMPARGAFCCRVGLGKNSTDAYLEKTVSWADDVLRYGRMRLFIGGDVQFGNNLDNVTLLQFYSDTDTKESRLLLMRNEPFGIVLTVIEEGTEGLSVDPAFVKVPDGKWLTLEFDKFADTANGDLGLFIPEVCHIQSRGAAEGTITKFRLGAIDQTGDIQGTLYFDEIFVDEDRLYDDPGPINSALSGGSLFMVQSGFAFLGAGEVEHVSVIDAGSADCRVKIYDTDYPTRLPAGGLRYDISAPAASATGQSTSRRVPFKRGAYVQLSGTNPQAIVRLGKVASDRAAG